MKEDERIFLKTCQKHIRPPQCLSDTSAVTARGIINASGFSMHHKRAWYLLQKWTDKGWYSYGTTLDLGWMTEKGLRVNADDPEMKGESCGKE